MGFTKSHSRKPDGFGYGPGAVKTPDVLNDDGTVDYRIYRGWGAMEKLSPW